MEHIWQLSDPNDFVIAMVEHLEEKTQYGDDMSVLSAKERIFYITQTLEMEVNNGGFSQFFFNSSGDFSSEIVSAFCAIEAHTTAGICEKALSAFGCEISTDRRERLKMLDEFDEDEINQIDEILDECDNAFYDYPDNLTELSYQFIMKNKELFT